ncbi:uncharacterized protein LOC111203080 [Brassica napus]|uniref:uncharacterized protein LOC111203080 n=1 Tax=Brassica napus TaxID=3708 RepID=UPI000BBE466A|nr:uncharacterized protein LOC111203080 [Brassica napus]
MDSRNPYSQSRSYVGLFNSQNFSYESYPSTLNFGASEIPPFSSQQTDAPDVCEDTPVACRERMKWTPADEDVLISAWLNTSKDDVVENEQKSGTFWKRVGEYYAASPHARESGEPREHLHCMSRNGLALTLLNLVGVQSKKLERHVDKLQAPLLVIMRSVLKVSRLLKIKKNNAQGKSLAEYMSIWEMKKEDLMMKEKLSKLAILDTLLAKKEPLSEAKEVVKNKLLAQYF